MLHIARTIVMVVLGCVLVPVCFVAVLLLPRRDGQGWRPQPPRVDIVRRLQE